MPTFKVWDLNHFDDGDDFPDDDALTVEADDDEDAARQAADYDSYALSDGVSSWTFHIRNTATGETTVVRVTVAYEPTYYAHRVKPKDPT